MSQHDQFSRALISALLDFPALMDDPVIASLPASTLSASYGEVLTTMRKLHAGDGLSVAKLAALLPPSLGFDLSYFARLRIECSELPMQDVSDYANALRQYSDRQGLDALALELARMVRTETPPAILAGQIMEKLAPFAIKNEKKPRTMREIVTDVYDDILARYANSSDIWGIPWGFPRLDKFTGGWQENELTILTGDSGLGKTYLATQIAMQAAQAAPGAFFSMEMGDKSIVRRMMKILGVNGKNIQTGFVKDEDWPVIGYAVEVVQNLPITLDTKQYTLPEIGARMSSLIADGVKWGIIDYLMLMDVQAKDETEKTAKISGYLKNFCNKTGFRLAVIHSLNKGGMDNDTAEKSNMRGSGQVTYDSDNVFMLNKFKPNMNDNFEKWILPAEGEKIVRLTIKKGRELDWTGGSALFKRMDASPKFTELDPDEKPAVFTQPKRQERIVHGQND